MPETLTLYTAKICPFAHRSELALEEAGAQYKKYQIDLKNKPEWYAPKVNPVSKVPAIAYGGPDVSPDQPSEQSVKLAESLILVEFVADLYPDSEVLPKDPVQRAKARFFIDAVSTKYLPANAGFSYRGESYTKVLEAIEALQALLPSDGKWALGDKFSAADISIAPFLGRGEISWRNEFVPNEGDGAKILEALQSPKFARFWQYFQDLKSRPSFQKTFDEEYLVNALRQRHLDLKA